MSCPRRLASDLKIRAKEGGGGGTAKSRGTSDSSHHCGTEAEEGAPSRRRDAGAKDLMALGRFRGTRRWGNFRCGGMLGAEGRDREAAEQGQEGKGGACEGEREEEGTGWRGGQRRNGMGGGWTGRFVLSRMAAVLLLASCAEALKCYVHQDKGGIPFTTKPSNSLDCSIPLNYNPLVEKDEFIAMTDEQVINEQPTCFKSCQGNSQGTASCTYSCTRWAACQMMQKISDDLAKTQERNVDPLYFPNCKLYPDREDCQKKFYSHSCCVIFDNCNSSSRSASISSFLTAMAVCLSLALAALRS